MNKIRYVFKRINSMDYKKMFTTIKNIHEKTGKNRLFLFFDMIYCGFKYQAGYMDYMLFEMYNLNRKQRKTIITRGINNKIVEKYNDKNYIYELDNKIEFNKIFNEYLNRDWMEVNGKNYDEFQEFILKHPEIIIKPTNDCCGHGIEKIKVNHKNIKLVYKEICETKRNLVEEVAIQCEKISKLHPDSINTLRVVTLNQRIVVAFLRIGNDHNVVDNFNHGGLLAPINIKTGTIDYPAISKDGKTYTKHPITNEKIIGFEIPSWDKVISYVEGISSKIKEIGYVGWDICLGDTPFIIEGNPFPGHDVYQLPPHRENGIGLLPTFEIAMKNI